MIHVDIVTKWQKDERITWARTGWHADKISWGHDDIRIGWHEDRMLWGHDDRMKGWKFDMRTDYMRLGWHEDRMTWG